MELAQDKIDLIEKLIKANRKFINNEDLYEDFFNETCKRSLPIISTISSDATLEVYLRKVATSSILNVLKDSGRLRRTKSAYVEYDNGPEDIAIQNEAVKLVANFLNEIDKNEPDKQYLEIYKLRYKEGRTQAEIASELNLSQSEVSKRLFKLMQKIKKSLND